MAFHKKKQRVETRPMARHENCTRWTLLLAAVGALLALAAPIRAADYPTRPITLVVAFTPGGPSDIIARIVGKKLETLLGQTVVVENRPGAGGNIAAEVVAHSTPDGYTLLMGNNSILATNAALYKHLTYDPEKDFAPISLIGSQANILVVNPSVPAHSLKELIALCKASPGKLNFASSGYGAAAHLAGELFKADAHVNIVHVPYKGAAPALQDVIAGHDQMMFATSASVISYIKSGTLRALAVTTLKRTAILPDLPTMDEAGLKGFEASTWHGLVAPAKTPPEIVAKLSHATVDALHDAGVQKSLINLGVDVSADTPDEFRAYIKSEIPKWTAIVKASGASIGN
jgi:tripartite-type tricarboxylate transporter receptor subunit TctC